MALIFELKVVPSSGKCEIIKDKKGELKCFLKGAPEKGEANRELIKELSRVLKIPQQDIEIVSGLTSRKKRIKVHTALTHEQLYQALGIDYQKNCLS